VAFPNAYRNADVYSLVVSIVRPLFPSQLEQLHRLVIRALDKYVQGSHYFTQRSLLVVSEAYFAAAASVPEEGTADGEANPEKIAELSALRQQLDCMRPPWHRTDWPAGCSDRSVVMATAGQALVDSLAAAECSMVSVFAPNDNVLRSCACLDPPGCCRRDVQGMLRWRVAQPHRL
jgi:hypothetical protein